MMISFSDLKFINEKAETEKENKLSFLFIAQG